MRIIKAAFSKTFPISQYYEKIYLEAELNEGDDVKQVLYDLKKTVNNFFYESNAAAEKQMGTTTSTVLYNPNEPEYPSTLTIEDQISSCTELKVLESYRLLVRNNPNAEKIYLQKLKELSNA